MLEFVSLAFMDIEDIALILLASSGVAGALSRTRGKPLAEGENFAVRAGAAAVAAMSPEAGGGVFHRPAWLKAASRAAAEKGCDIRLFGIDRAGRPSKSLALRIERRGALVLAFPILDPLAQYTEMHGEGDSRAFIERVARQLRETTDAHALVLSRVPSGGALAEALRAAGAFTLRTGRAPFIDLTRFSSHGEWLESFSATTRKSRRQRRRKLEASGVVRFEVLAAGPEAAEVAARLVEMKRRWMHRCGLKSRVLDDPIWTSALLEVAASPDSGGMVSRLTLDGVLVAGELGFVAGDTYLSYLGAYEPAQAHLGVGSQQIAETVGWCFENGIRTFDLLPPADDYKLRWTSPDCQREVADYVLPLHRLGTIGASFAARFIGGSAMLRTLARQFG